MNVGTAVPDWPNLGRASLAGDHGHAGKAPNCQIVPNLARGPTTGLVRAGLADCLQDGRSAN
jgi:hypothetical protein